MKAPKIILKNYEKLLFQVRNHVEKTQSSITKIVTRQKVEMAWNIGKSIEEHLGQQKTNHNKHLLERLSEDVGIAQSVLYKMRSFYKSYPELPRDDDKLNWSHYRVLSGIKSEESRKYLEDLTREKNLDAETLSKKIKKTRISEIREGSKARRFTAKPKKLYPKRGKLFSYALLKREELGQTCIDCGFVIFKSVENAQKNLGKIVETVKKNKNYSLQKTSLEARQINVYKGYLTRVVDGDTIHATLDLGFEIFHEEILRLRGIDAPEMSTAAGQKSSAALKRILKNIPFLIVKTTANDVYGRYVADVFLADEAGKFSAQEVADGGVYLNQLLLDCRVVTAF